MSEENQGRNLENHIVLAEEESRIFKNVPHKDNVRAIIAYVLLAILAAEVFLAFIIVIFVDDISESVREVLSIVFSPTIALVGAATGFYYGVQETPKDPQDR